MRETKQANPMYIAVKVTPDAKKEKLAALSENSFEVSVKEKARKNMANRRVCQIMANHFNVSLKQAKIIAGHHSPKKIIDISL